MKHLDSYLRNANLLKEWLTSGCGSGSKKLNGRVGGRGDGDWLEVVSGWVVWDERRVVLSGSGEIW